MEETQKKVRKKRASRPLTTRCFISIDGADPVPLESVPEEQMEEIRKKWGERVGRTMSLYYNLHPEEYIALLKSLDERDKKKAEGEHA